MNKCKFRHISVLLILCGVYIAEAQSPETYFENANRAYADGDYQLALDLYSKIIEDKIESGEVYFNMGNAHFKMNNIGLSMLYYEKARLYLEGDPALEQNIRLTQLRVVDKIDAVPILFLEEWWTALLNLFSYNTLLWLTLFLFTLLIVLIITQLFLNRRYLRRLIWIFSAVFFVAFFISVSQIIEIENTKSGIILEDKVSVVSEPNLDGTEVFILHEGTKVSVNRELNDWLEISIPDGKTGWLKTTSIGFI
jgi:tetratricopeptide (TPR) repeat protein